MDRLREILVFFATLDLGKVLFKIYQDKETQDFIVFLNNHDQLFVKRSDSKGKTLEDIGGGYSPVTEELNEGVVFEYRGSFNTKITGESPFLFDTGDFYDSFVVRPLSDGFEIDANPIKDDTNLFREWGEDILGLDSESLIKLNGFLIEKIMEALTLEQVRLQAA